MEYPVMVDPVGGVGGVQDTLIFPGSVRGVADIEEGAGASVEEDMHKNIDYLGFVQLLY
jgi:hypothetical protein